MHFEQPKPDSKKYADLISDIEKGIIKIPKFQREFVWGIDKTAKLLDSILKGYPIGTFILWKTDERINDINISFPHYDNKQICLVQVSRSGRPVFTNHEGKDEFFVRTGCSSQPLGRSEQSTYEREHWA